MSTLRLLKKGQGINLSSLKNREKAIIINALRDRHLLRDLLKSLHMVKSSYCYQVAIMKNDKYAHLRIEVKVAFHEANSCYGYRRIHSVIKTTGVMISEKIIRRVMKEEKLIVPNIQRKKYNSYRGEIGCKVENIIDRDFHISQILSG